jgi:hypothetical protein
MAVRCIALWEAKRVMMTYGTGYHVGEQAEDFEYNIAPRVKATIEGRLLFELGGMVIDARHFVGSSGIPHGRGTALLREVMWSLVEEADGMPKVDMIIRSHVHYHIWIEQPGKIALTTPALQLRGGRFGSRKMTGKVHWGAIRLTIQDGQIIGREVSIWNLAANKPKIIKIK